jgi:hypothetical protein
MIIKVIYTDDGLGLVNARDLEHLIKTRKILAFERSSGWVTIGSDPIRQKDTRPVPTERRAVLQHTA